MHEASVLVVGLDLHGEATALVEILRDEGVNARVASRGEDAVVAAASGSPDLIIIDADFLLVESELLDRLRRARPDQDIVLVTGWPIDDQHVRSLVRQVEGRCLLKPVDLDELLAVVLGAAERRHGMRSARNTS